MNTERSEQILDGSSSWDRRPTPLPGYEVARLLRLQRIKDYGILPMRSVGHDCAQLLATRRLKKGD